MPRFAILTGTRHGETAPVVIQDSSASVAEQQTAFKVFAGKVEHEEFREVHLWTSDSGIIARRRFKPVSAPVQTSEPPPEDPPKPKGKR